jgi:hypothetical protein
LTRSRRCSATICDYVHMVIISIVLGPGASVWAGLEELERRFEVQSSVLQATSSISPSPTARRPATGRPTKSSINPRLGHVDAVRRETRLGQPLQPEGEGRLKVFGTALRSEFYVILTQGCDNPIVPF